MENLKKDLKDLMLLILLIASIWVSVTSIIQRFKCPNLSETELFVRIPKNFAMSWETCEQ